MSNKKRKSSGNDTKDQHWIGENLTYDANHTDYDDLRDKKKREACERRIPHLAKDDKFHSELESANVELRAGRIKAYNSDKDTVAERRGYRNRLKEAEFNAVKRQEISRADALANKTGSDIDDRAVDMVEDELVFGDDIADMEEKPGVEGVVEETVRRVIRHEIADEISEAEAEDERKQPEF